MLLARPWVLLARPSTSMPTASETPPECPQLQRLLQYNAIVYPSANTFGPVQLEEGQGLVQVVQGMSIKNVSFEAIVSSIFLRNQQQTKSLTWLSVSSLLKSQVTPNLTASRHNLVAIQLSFKTLFTWQFKLLHLIFFPLRLAQVTRLENMFEMSQADLKQWQAQQFLQHSICFVQDSIWKASTLSVRLLKSTSPKFQRFDSEICFGELRLSFFDVL